MKKNNKSAVTSVKGNKQPSQQKLTNSHSNLMRNKTQKKSQQEFSRREIPTRVSYQRNAAPHTFKSFNRGNVHGMRVSGSFFLDDVSGLNLKSLPSSRWTSIKYLHPNMVGGNLSLMSSAFTKYRFNRLRLVYVSQTSMSTNGLVHLLYVDDPVVDPTVLRDRQLKIFLESSPCKYTGPLFSEQKVAHVDCNLKDSDHWKYLDISRTEISDVYQGRFFLGVTGTDKKANIGEVYIDFECDLVSELLSPQSVLNMSMSNDLTYDMQVDANTAKNENVKGSFLNTSATVWQKLPAGVYSIQINGAGPSASEDTYITSNQTKPISVGTELFVAKGNTDSETSSAIPLFGTIAELLMGKPITSLAAQGVTTWFARLLPVIKDVASSLFGTESNPTALAICLRDCAKNDGTRSGVSTPVISQPPSISTGHRQTFSETPTTPSSQYGNWYNGGGRGSESR